MIVRCKYNICYCALHRTPTKWDGLFMESQCVEQDVQNKCKEFQLDVDNVDDGCGCHWGFMTSITVICEVDSVDIYQEYVSFGNVYVEMQDLILLEIDYGNGFETECYGFAYVDEDEE